MENCLSKNRDINVVYTINEPTANGAYAALKAAGKDRAPLIVSVDGGCAGVKAVKAGVIGATSQQYPSKMASLGVDAINKIVNGGKKPAEQPGAGLLQHRRAARHRQAGRRCREHRHADGREDLLGLSPVTAASRSRSVAAGPAAAPTVRVPTVQYPGDGVGAMIHASAIEGGPR